MKKIISNTATVMLALALTLLFVYTPPFQSGELKVRDMLFQIRGEADLSSSDIIIVEISESADYEIPYKWPWPMHVHAKLVENLAKAGAKAVAFDVLFDQPDMYDVKNDTLFAEALEKAGNVVLAGGFRRILGNANIGNVITDQTFPEFPRQLFVEATPWQVGFVEMLRDIDGGIRTYPLQQNQRGQSYYSLSLQLAQIVNHEEFNPPYKHSEKSMMFGDMKMPKSNSGRMLINYTGGYRSFEYIGYEEIIDDSDFKTTTELEAFEINAFDDPDYGLLNRKVLKDKIVLIGATMPALQDFHQVPFQNNNGEYTMAGVEIHANALRTLLSGEFISELSGFSAILIVFIMLLFTFFITRKYVGWIGITGALSMFMIWTVTAIILFTEFQLFIPVLSVYVSILFGFTGSTIQNVIQEVKEKSRIREMFTSYVSPQLVDQLIEEDIGFQLGGREEVLTVLFSDIEKFSSLSELYTASELVDMMNRYLSIITDRLIEQNGTLDKYIGDAVMAIFGAPVSNKNHAADACRTALNAGTMWIDAESEVNNKLELRTRFGINTGKMIVGNMGSSKRFNYTVMGDHVNIAARCESVCKIFGVYVIITRSTFSEAEKTGEFIFRYLGKVRVKGRNEPVEIYQLLDYSRNADDETRNLISIFEEGLSYFYKRNFKEAAACFEQTRSCEESHLKSGPESNPSVLYLLMCEKYKKEDLTDKWDGVIKMSDGE